MSTAALIAVEFRGRKLLFVIEVVGHSHLLKFTLTFLFFPAPSVRVKREPSEEDVVSSQLGPGTGN